MSVFFLATHQICLGNVFARCLGIMDGQCMMLTGRTHLLLMISIPFKNNQNVNFIFKNPCIKQK